MSLLVLACVAVCVAVFVADVVLHERRKRRARHRLEKAKLRVIDGGRR